VRIAVYARRRGIEPSLAAVAHTLHVSRSRVRSRLQELGLLESLQPSAPERSVTAKTVKTVKT